MIEKYILNFAENLRASRPEEIKSPLEVGFEYACEKDGLLYFIKRK